MPGEEASDSPHRPDGSLCTFSLKHFFCHEEPDYVFCVDKSLGAIPMSAKKVAARE